MAESTPPTTHQVRFSDRRSFNFRIVCMTCGWESRLHLMEKDALEEGHDHVFPSATELGETPQP